LRKVIETRTVSGRRGAKKVKELESRPAGWGKAGIEALVGIVFLRGESENAGTLLNSFAARKAGTVAGEVS